MFIRNFANKRTDLLSEMIKAESSSKSQRFDTLESYWLSKYWRQIVCQKSLFQYHLHLFILYITQLITHILLNEMIGAMMYYKWK